MIQGALVQTHDMFIGLINFFLSNQLNSSNKISNRTATINIVNTMEFSLNAFHEFSESVNSVNHYKIQKTVWLLDALPVW